MIDSLLPQMRIASEVFCSHTAVTESPEGARYLEHGRLSPGRSKAITALVNELCAAVRPVALELVDAFGIPGAAVEAAVVVPSQHE